MSAQARPRGQLTFPDFQPPEPPFEPGDFALITQRKYDLLWCPLCVLDPERDPYRFGFGERRDDHFENEHDADDVGRPMAELLPERDSR